MTTGNMNQKGFLGWIIVVTVLIIIVITSIVIAVNLSGSIPGDLIYPVKEISENIRLGANELSFEGRASAHIDETNERAREIVTLIERKENEEKIVKALERLQLTQKKALENIGKARSKGTNMTIYIGKLEASFTRQQQVLQDLTYQVPSSLYDIVNKTMLETDNNLIKIGQIRTYQ